AVICVSTIKITNQPVQRRRVNSCFASASFLAARCPSLCTNSHIHYDSSQARLISVREAARLQLFPDGFRFLRFHEFRLPADRKRRARRGPPDTPSSISQCSCATVSDRAAGLLADAL